MRQSLLNEATMNRSGYRIAALCALLVGVAGISGATAQPKSCPTCNCQINNIELLDQLVEAKIKHLLADEPLLRLLHLRRGSGTQLTLAASNRITRKGNNATRLATVSLSNPSQPVTSSNNLLAYRPRFADFHGSNLAAVFINMEGVYPCLQTLTGNYLPLCQVLSEEDDGFRRGKALIGAGDSGNHFRVFSTSSVLTYGVAIQDCPEFSTTCLPVLSSFTVACILPRTPCS